MRLFLTGLILFIFKIGFSQTGKYSVEVFISGRVDTTYSTEKKEIYKAFKGYLESRPDSFYNNPYWTNKDKIGSDSGCIATFHKGLNTLQIKPEQLYGLWKPYILTLEKSNEKKYVLKIALIKDGNQFTADKFLTILNLNAIHQNGKWVFENTLEDVVKTWNTYTYKYIKYITPPGRPFNELLANQAVKFCDSIGSILKVRAIDTITFFICENPDQLGELLGYDFFYINYTTGLTNTSLNQIYSAKSTEYYPHEFIHPILRSMKCDSISYVVEEGLACFLGEIGTEKYKAQILNLRKDYLSDNGSTLVELLQGKSRMTGYQPAYPTGSIIAEVFYSNKGYEGIIKLARANTTDPEMFFKSVKTILGMSPKEFEQAFRQQISKHN